MRTAFKCRAYPTPEQAAILGRTFGCVRVVWNRTLDWRSTRYHRERAKTSYAQASVYLTTMKAGDDLAWLNEVSSVPLQQALRHQQDAFAAFFDGRARYPRYKSRAGRQSAEYTRSGFRWRGGQLFLAKMGVPLALAWSWPGTDPASIGPSTITVSRESDGRWYVSLSVDVADPEPLPGTGHTVGIDLGVKDFATLSTGRKIPNPRHLKRKARNIARYQRRLTRCQQGSNNRAKAKAKVARAHRKVRNARNDSLHKTSTALVRSYDVIAIEDLNLAGMTRRPKPRPDSKGGYERNGAAAKSSLNKSLLDTGIGEFRRQLEYKCERYGRTLTVIDRWHPSSKACNACGHVLEKLSLKTRQWTCPACGTRHDRDINAAKNILAAGQAVVRSHPGDACGAGVRHEETPPVRSAAKQEPQPVRAGIPVLQAGSSQHLAGHRTNTVAGMWSSGRSITSTL